jgi:glycerol kinase
VADDILLAIDQGTSSTRAIGLSVTGDVVAVEQQSFEQIYPGPGWVEHDAEVIWATVMSTSRRVLQRLVEAKRMPAAIGITNQRETTILWDRRSGAPIYNAIVWQDRRTADRCRQLERDHGEAEVSRKTGLRLDPYFSATKIAWILDRVPGAREAADRRPAAPHGRHECEPNGSLRYRQGALGRGSVRNVRCAHERAAGGTRQCR